MTPQSHEPTSPDSRGSPIWARPRFVCALGLLGIGWVLLALHQFSRTTCAVCRLDRVEHHILGLRWSSFEENDLSQWYPTHVEPTHVHAWIPRGQCRSFGIPFVYWGYACTMGSPLAGFSRTVQQQTYERCPNRLEAKRMFLDLARDDQYSTDSWNAFSDWATLEFPGTWDQWRAKTPAERAAAVKAHEAKSQADEPDRIP